MKKSVNFFRIFLMLFLIIGVVACCTYFFSPYWWEEGTYFLSSLYYQTIRPATYLEKEALAFEKSGDYEKAIKCYDKIISISPFSPKALIKKGDFLVRIDRIKEAYDCFDKAISTNPSTEELWVEAYLCFVRSEKTDKGIIYLDKALTLFPSSVFLWLLKGEGHHTIGEYSKALMCYDKIIEIDPHSPCVRQALLNKRGILFKQDRFEEAFIFIDKFYPEEKVSWLENGGEFLAARGRYEEAIPFFKECLEIEPENLKASESIKLLNQVIDGKAKWKTVPFISSG